MQSCFWGMHFCSIFVAVFEVRLHIEINGKETFSFLAILELTESQKYLDLAILSVVQIFSFYPHNEFEINDD